MRPLTPKLAGLLDRGLEDHKTGNIEQALKSYDAVLRKRPGQPDALWLRGVALMHQGQNVAAVKSIERACKARPHDPEILNDLGMAYEAQENQEAAVDAYRKALKLGPDVAAVQINIARCELSLGNSSAALEAVDKALALQPAVNGGHNLRGVTLKSLGRQDEALSAFAAAISHEPNNAVALVNKGELLREMGQLERARVTLERAVAISQQGSQDWANALVTLGLLATNDGSPETAKKYYDEVLLDLPDHLEALVNRGELNQSIGNIEAAEADCAAALKVDRSCAEARFNLGRIHLLHQRWDTGWEDYAARWQTEDFSSQNRSRGIPPWDGQTKSGSKLLIWGEQGLGDQILFTSQIPDLLRKELNPVIEIDPRLVPLIKRSFSGLEVFAYDSIDPEIQSSIDHEVPIGSLGRVLRKTSESFGTAGPYLHAEPGLTRQLRKRYLKGAQGRKVIGIAWHSINPFFGADKSLSLERWEPILAQHADTFFVSLQYGAVHDTVKAASDATGADILIDPEVDPIADFDAAAAQVGAMDLIISTSNTAVHLAGALGKPTWVMVPHVPEWRWGLEGESVPWYESVRVFRQAKQGDWDSVLTVVDGELRRYLSTE